MFCQAKDDNDKQESIQKGLPTADWLQNVGHLETEQCSCRTRGDVDVCSFFFMCLLTWLIFLLSVVDI